MIRITPKIESFFLLPFQTYPEISSKSVHKFLSYLVHKRTNKPMRKRNLLHGGNYREEYTYSLDRELYPKLSGFIPPLQQPESHGVFSQ